MTLYSGGDSFRVYKSRDNVLRLQLIQDGAVVTTDAVIRAVLRLRNPSGTDIILDTNDAGDDLTLTDNATVVQVGADGLSSTEAGAYESWLTIYDSANLDGIAWASPTIEVVEWKSDE